MSYLLFEGAFAASLDDRSRLTIPEAFRSQLGREVIVVAAAGATVRVYPAEAHDALAAAAAADISNPFAFVSCSLTRTAVDSVGRMLIQAPMVAWLHLRFDESGPAEKVIVAGGAGCVTLISNAGWRGLASTFGIPAAVASAASG
ncbi:MAG: hypothetical protein KGJ62_07960 [Armatimonadetes bacterium]|nr:hypothetical protein [Armatimonadota bacterium]MDE2205210.1 hypothetical protein [Armatimonadota bacterium]